MRTRGALAMTALLALTALTALVAPACERRSGAPEAATSPSTLPAPAVTAGASGEWAAVMRAPTAEVTVERALYESAGTPHFFVHVRVVNAGASALWVDLRDRVGVVYPNQWGASDTVHRQGIDETRLPVPPLDAATRARLLADARSGQLTSIPAHGAVDYFHEFNASSRADVETQTRAARYLILAMDGRIDVSDGADVRRLAFARDDETTREVTLDVPVRWGHVPARAIVIADR